MAHHSGKEIKSKNFIELYDNALTDDQCDELICLYKNDYRKMKGSVGRGGNFNSSKKISTDVGISVNNTMSEDKPYNDIILPSLNKLLRSYANTYYFLNDVNEWSISKGYNIQAYKEGEGYGKQHCENSGYAGDAQTRMLAWMIYLNNAKSGTVFPYQKTTLQPKKGTCAIWPAYWTHPHYGEVPNKGFKIIATGWCNYNI